MSHVASSTHGLMLAVGGILLLSPDTLLVRLLDMDPWPLVLWRGVGTALVLALAIALLRGRSFVRAVRAIGAEGMGMALCFGASNICFITAMEYTSVANVLACIATAPVFGALFTRVFLGERLPARTWWAVAGSVVAVAIIVGGDLSHGSAAEDGQNHLLGDVLALGNAMLLAGTLTLARRKPHVDMTPAMALAGVLAAGVATVVMISGNMAASQLPQALLPPVQLAPVFLVLVLVVVPISFMLLTHAPRHIPPPEVNMIMLLEMVLGPAFVWLGTGEHIPPATLLGGCMLLVILLCHGLLGLHAHRRRQRTVQARPPGH